MREIAGCCQSALDHPFAMIQKRVQIVDEWLQFNRIISPDAAVAATSHVRQSRTKCLEWRQTTAQPEKSSDHEQRGDDQYEVSPEPRDEHFDCIGVAIEILRVDMLGQFAL